MVEGLFVLACFAPPIAVLLSAAAFAIGSRSHRAAEPAPAVHAHV